jgi:hypothetical protein
MTESTQTPNSYSVSIWEMLAIALGAILIVVIGLAGLGLKFINNAFDPRRAEAIAQSLIRYKIPGGSSGVFGTNIGGAQISLIRSTQVYDPLPPTTVSLIPPPLVELFIARVPFNSRVGEAWTEDDTNQADTVPRVSFSYEPDGAFQAVSSRTEGKNICGVIVPVTIQVGTLSWAEETVNIPAARYDVSLTLDNYTYLLTLSALGLDADKNANDVFASLQCNTKS